MCRRVALVVVLLTFAGFVGARDSGVSQPINARELVSYCESPLEGPPPPSDRSRAACVGYLAAVRSRLGRLCIAKAAETDPYSLGGWRSDRTAGTRPQSPQRPPRFGAHTRAKRRRMRARSQP